MPVTLASVSISPERWIDLIEHHGPAAMLVFVVFVLLGFLVTKFPGKQEVLPYVFIVAWTSVFLLIGFVEFTFWKASFPDEYVVRGRITNLTYPQIIETDQELFLRRHPLVGSDFEYDWRLISSSRFSGQLELMLQQRPDDALVLKYKISIRQEFYDCPVELEYDRATFQIKLRCGKIEEFIAPQPGVAGNDHLEKPESDIVYAASMPQASPEELLRLLDADDPLIRRNARLDLAKLGSGAFPSLSKVLIDPKGSYRLRLGALATVSDMGAIANEGLSEAGRCSIVRSSTNADPTIRQAAKDLLHSTITLPERCLHPIDIASGPSGIFILDGSGAVFNIHPDEQGLHVEPITVTQLHHYLGHPYGYISVDGDSIFVATDAANGCSVLRYSLAEHNSDQPLIRPARESSSFYRCGGIATYGEMVYLFLPGENKVEYWANWNQPQPSGWYKIIRGESNSYKVTSLTLDRSGRRILANRFGVIYSVTLNSPTNSPMAKLRDTQTDGNAIAADKTHIWVTRGSRLISLNNNGLNSEVDTSPQFTRRKDIVGLAVDESKNLWVADTGGRLTGPLVIK